MILGSAKVGHHKNMAVVVTKLFSTPSIFCLKTLGFGSNLTSNLEYRGPDSCCSPWSAKLGQPQAWRVLFSLCRNSLGKWLQTRLPKTICNGSWQFLVFNRWKHLEFVLYNDIQRPSGKHQCFCSTKALKIHLL